MRRWFADQTLHGIITKACSGLTPEQAFSVIYFPFKDHEAGTEITSLNSGET